MKKYGGLITFIILVVILCFLLSSAGCEICPGPEKALEGAGSVEGCYDTYDIQGRPIGYVEPKPGGGYKIFDNAGRHVGEARER